MSRRTWCGLVGSSALAMGVGSLAACTSKTPAATPTALDKSTVSTLVAAVTTSTPKTLVMPRLAEGVTPPTNHWFTGLVFGDQAQPVFPMPLGFALTKSGFEFWLPKVVVNAKTIGAEQGPRLALSVDGVTGGVVSAYDAASVVVQLRDASGAGVADVRLVQGSPTISVKAIKDVKLTGSGAFTAVGSAWQATLGATVFGLTGDVKVSGSDVTLASGQTGVFFVPPTTGMTVADLASKARAVTGTDVTYEIGTNDVTTTIRYAAGGPAMVVSMPHHEGSLVSKGQSLGSYDSVYGKLELYATETLVWRAKRWDIRTALDLSKLSSDQKAKLATQVAADVASSKPYPEDSYFGGKGLYRDAMLMEIAKAVGANDAAKTVKDRLTTALQRWTEPKGADARATECFVYDATYHGMIGLKASFGSDEYNDHHFHYGYFLYAAGVLCADDSALAARLAPVMDLLAADIASPTDTGFFPQWRPFDAYASHSWASGTSPFADGNNQESSSEAVNAWAGLALWARARGDKAMEQQATWMHSLEAQTALAYWLAPDMSAFPGFQHHIVGIGFGAKRDYATWFSPDPTAILTIQVLPASPSAGYLAASPDRVSAAVAEAVGSGDYRKTYGDYCLLYSALASKDAAAKALDTAPSLADHIDDGSSMSYLLAYLMTR
ncbi:MAG TPA: glycosyl hydrolase [Propionibacteriaceae bacterium]